MTALRLFGFWRSMAAYRVRVALNLKGLAYEDTPVDLERGEQFASEFVALNPEAVVPALIEGDAPPLTQSMAILEFIEERFPQPPLLPADLHGRARVRALAALIVADTHPLLTHRVQAYLAGRAGLDAPSARAWSVHWISRAVAALEARLAGDPATGAFCHGDAPTMADICLASLLTARGAGYRLSEAPTVARIVAACDVHPAFQAAEPARQPGAPA